MMQGQDVVAVAYGESDQGVSKTGVVGVQVKHLEQLAAEVDERVRRLDTALLPVLTPTPPQTVGDKIGEPHQIRGTLAEDLAGTAAVLERVITNLGSLRDRPWFCSSRSCSA